MSYNYNHVHLHWNNLEQRLKALEIENASLKNLMNTVKWHMKSIIWQTCMSTVVFIRNQ